LLCFKHEQFSTIRATITLSCVIVYQGGHSTIKVRTKWTIPWRWNCDCFICKKVKKYYESWYITLVKIYLCKLSKHHPEWAHSRGKRHWVQTGKCGWFHSIKRLDNLSPLDILLHTLTKICNEKKWKTKCNIFLIQHT